MIAFPMFAAITLALLTAGLLRVVWVVMFDEYIGLAKPPEDRPPSRFEVLVNPQLVGVTPARLASDGSQTPGTGTAGRYRVSGVMTAIGAEVTLRLEAGSPAHARQKAEFGGVAVTNVTRDF